MLWGYFAAGATGAVHKIDSIIDGIIKRKDIGIMKKEDYMNKLKQHFPQKKH